MKYKTINIHFQPPANVVAKITDLNHKFSQLMPSAFIYGEQTFVHLTIYFAEFPVKNYSKVIEIVNSKIKDIKPLSFEYEKTISDDGYLMVGFNKSEAFSRLHEDFIKALNPLREGHQRDKYLPDTREYQSLSTSDKKLLDKYGSYRFGGNFTPHMTIIKTDDKYAPMLDILKDTFVWDISEFTCNKIVISTGAKHGTVIKNEAEFTLT